MEVELEFRFHFKINPMFSFLFSLEFTLCKAEQSLQGIKLQEKKEEKDGKHIGKLVGKNPNMPHYSTFKGIKIAGY